MSIISEPHELLDADTYVHLSALVGRDLYLKCEGFNFGGSVKMQAAAAMVEAAERDGLLRPGTKLVESSSGNLGIALSVVSASKGIRFTCVTDHRCNASTLRLMAALGTHVVVIDEPDPVGGLLGARKEYVRHLCRSDPSYVWLNQYENPANWMAHYDRTAVAIAKQFPEIDVLFVGAGTCGTLMGCARYFRDYAKDVRVVAVDSVGSANLGGPAGPRFIPGIGSSLPAAALDLSLVADTVHVSEVDTVRTCRALAAHGFVFGGSTGTVVSGALEWLTRHDPDRSLTCVAIAPDFGDRYLNTVYDDQWVIDNVGAGALTAHLTGRRLPA
jgi:cysteine synthase A